MTDGWNERVTERLSQFMALLRRGLSPKNTFSTRNEVVYEEEVSMLNLLSQLTLLIPFATTRTLEASPRERACFFAAHTISVACLFCHPFYELHSPPAVPSPSINPVLFARAILAVGLSLSFSGGSQMSTVLRQQRAPLEDLGGIVNTSIHMRFFVCLPRFRMLNKNSSVRTRSRFIWRCVLRI